MSTHVLRPSPQLLVVHDHQVEHDLQDLEFQLLRRVLDLAEEQLQRLDGDALRGVDNDVVEIIENQVYLGDETAEAEPDEPLLADAQLLAAHSRDDEVCEDTLQRGVVLEVLRTR